MKSADTVTQNVISTYDFSVSHNTNVTKISSSKFGPDDLETCGKFLGLTTRDDNDKKIFTNKPTIADRIVIKIESYFTSVCQECNEQYRAPFEEDSILVPRLRCYMCFQPSHICEKILKFLQSPDQADVLPSGTAWLCRRCYLRHSLVLSKKSQE